MSGAAEARPSAPDEDLDFTRQLESWRLRIEHALAGRLPRSDSMPTRLHEAMRYCVLGGGKRVRPTLLFAAAQTLGLRDEEVEAAACAVELVHVYCFVHGDLPAVDDENVRNGRPACHKAYDQATATLVGDALPPLAFQLLACDPALPAAAAIRLRLIDLLAQASAPSGVSAGEAADAAALEDSHPRNSKDLIRASVMMAAECVPALDAERYGALSRFAAAIGLAFQIRDDSASQERVRELQHQAQSALAPFGERAAPLRRVAEWMLP